MSEPRAVATGSCANLDNYPLPKQKHPQAHTSLRVFPLYSLRLTIHKDDIPGPTAEVFVFRIVNPGSITKLVAILIGPLRFFVIKREWIDIGVLDLRIHFIDDPSDQSLRSKSRGLAPWQRDKRPRQPIGDV